MQLLEGISPILMAEDNENDVIFTQRAINRAGIRNPLQVVENGREAIDYLSGAHKYADRDRYPLPVLLVLDIKMPMVSGLEVLKWVRQNPPLRLIPVVMLTSSPDDRDLAQAYALGANSYLVKPASMDELTAMIKTFGEYWLLYNRPPPVPKQELRAVA